MGCLSFILFHCSLDQAAACAVLLSDLTLSLAQACIIISVGCFLILLHCCAMQMVTTLQGQLRRGKNKPAGAIGTSSTAPLTTGSFPSGAANMALGDAWVGSGRVPRTSMANQGQFQGGGEGDEGADGSSVSLATMGAGASSSGQLAVPGAPPSKQPKTRLGPNGARRGLGKSDTAPPR